MNLEDARKFYFKSDIKGVHYSNKIELDFDDFLKIMEMYSSYKEKEKIRNDLDSEEIKKTIKMFYRIIKPG